MRPLALFALVLSPGFGGEARYARLGELDGKVEMQLRAGEPWVPAMRNTPLPESSWVRTGAGSAVELELDEGSVVRLSSDSLCELSDYTRLSTGQRITLISVDHGLAYFTGEAQAKDALILAVPGAQVTMSRRTRLRLEVREDRSEIAVLEAAARFSSPTAELELHEGQIASVDSSRPGKFYLYREIPPLDTDRWSEQRDKIFAAPVSGNHVRGLRYGLPDLDANGGWITMSDYGTVWKPKAGDGWAPYRDGKWIWYDTLGYTWVGGEAWGWLPYHYGRWLQQDSVGWVWVPGPSAIFKPGDVYWVRGMNLVGWGPLAPGEDWKGSSMPRLYLNANTTFAKFALEMREIQPDGQLRPKEPLAAASFVLAPPSPTFVAARLEATRPALRAGSTRVLPMLTGVTYEGVRQAVETAPPQPTETITLVPPPVELPQVIVTVPPPQPVIPTYYPVPVYTGIVVVNPPERDHPRHHQELPPPPSPAAPRPAPGPPPIPRGERIERRAAERDAQPAPEPHNTRAEPPIPRYRDDSERPERSERGERGGRRNQ